MYPALFIADIFVKKGIEDANPVSQMKLQKLVYFAHGFHLAQYETPLIREQFEAWEYGPVIPGIYQQYKIYGSDAIIDTSLLFLFSNTNQKETVKENLDKEALDTINVTWDSLKNIPAITLSSWTHKEGSPWRAHYKNGIIPNDEIQTYFQREFIAQ